MKIIYRLLAVAYLFASLLPVLAKSERVKQSNVYMFGLAVSYVDSTAYMTDMQIVEGVTIEKKTGFLMDRQLYSLQLQRTLQEKYGKLPFVPAVFFSTNQKELEREYLKVRKAQTSQKWLRIVPLDQGQFRFQPEEYIEQQLSDETQTKKSKNKEKKSKKK